MLLLVIKDIKKLLQRNTTSYIERDTKSNVKRNAKRTQGGVRTNSNVESLGWRPGPGFLIHKAASAQIPTRESCGYG